jgi:ketosteroid isomerase-like protein
MLLRVPLVFSLLLLGSHPAFGVDDIGQDDLDAFWAEVSRTVAEGDFEGYAATYHEDAVLVSGLSGTSYPISQALDGWKQGFTDTKAGTVSASVEFRFTQRLSDATTAHQTGIFHYAVVDAQGQRTEQFIHFEALLVKKQGWKMMMEYQKSRATREEWEAAG